MGLILVGFAGVLSSCVQTTYKTYYETENSEKSSDARLVKYEVDKAFYRSPPDCVVVLPAKGRAKAKDKILIERAAARHLRGKIERVIGPDERRSLSRRLALDFTNEGDRRYFASYRHKGRSCRFFAMPTIYSVEENYALIWASRRVHLGLEILSGSSGDSLWKGEHATNRGDGGPPLSPFSPGSAAIRAVQVKADKDMLPSMIDDVFRRILVTLPDTRSY
jgi:hypothetical protein